MRKFEFGGYKIVENPLLPANTVAVMDGMHPIWISSVERLPDVIRTPRGLVRLEDCVIECSALTFAELEETASDFEGGRM